MWAPCSLRGRYLPEFRGGSHSRDRRDEASVAASASGGHLGYSPEVGCQVVRAKSVPAGGALYDSVSPAPLGYAI